MRWCSFAVQYGEDPRLVILYGRSPRITNPLNPSPRRQGNSDGCVTTVARAAHRRAPQLRTHRATARDAFAEMGPDAPLDVIARRADVGSATLYRHFPTREELLHATYRPEIEAMARRAVELADYFPPAEALERWLRDYFVPAQEERGVASMVKDALVTAPEVFSQSKEQFSNSVDSLVHAAQTSGDLRK